MNDLSMLVAEHLKLDVARMLQEPFGVHVRVAKSLLRLAACGLIRVQQLSLMAHDAHPTAATTGDRFQNQWISDTFGFFTELFLSLDGAIASRNRRKSGAFHLPARTVLFPHHFDHFGRRTAKRDLGSLANLGEIG